MEKERRYLGATKKEWKVAGIILAAVLGAALAVALAPEGKKSER